MLKYFILFVLIVAFFDTRPAFSGEIYIPPTTDDIASCDSLAEVTFLNPDGDNFLALRMSPSTNGDMLAKLPPDTQVFACDYKDGWFAVIVKSESLDCEIPFSDAYYNGPCLAGWVYGKYLRHIAG